MNWKGYLLGKAYKHLLFADMSANFGPAPKIVAEIAEKFMFESDFYSNPWSVSTFVLKITYFTVNLCGQGLPLFLLAIMSQ